MASNKRAGGLDQSTRAALSGLKWALEQTAEKPLQPDEFTGQQFHAAREGNTLRSSQSLLGRMIGDGLLTSRKITLNGKIQNAYKKA